MSAFGGKADMF